MVACVREVAGKAVRGVGVISGTVGTNDDFSYNAAMNQSIWLALKIL